MKRLFIGDALRFEGFLPVIVYSFASFNSSFLQFVVDWETGFMEGIYKQKIKSQNSIPSKYDEALHAHTTDMKRVNEKITDECEKFLQDYKQRFLQAEALSKSLQQRECELKNKEQKLLKDKQKLQLKKRMQERVSSCKQLVNECYTSREVAEGQKRELDILHKRRAELENKLKAKSFKSLQNEITNLDIALHDIEADDQINHEETLMNLQREVIEKEEQLHDLKNWSNAFSLTIDEKNIELQEARQELIDGLKTYNPCSVNIKTMGVLDSTSFFVEDCSSKTSKKNANNYTLVWRYLKDPDWHPFKVITVGSEKKEIIDEKDEKIVRLKGECSEEQYHAVVTVLNERNEYGNLTQELWDFKEQRKASLKQGIDYILKEWKKQK